MDRLTKKAENPYYSNDYDMLCAHDYHVLNKLGKIEDLMEKYNVEDIEDVERALIVEKIIKNGFVYYEDDYRVGTYHFGGELEFDFETNEIVLRDAYDYDYDTRWVETARLPILDYKKRYWLKKDKSE